MRVLGTVGLLVGICGALCGIAYSAFVLMREGTFLTEAPIAVTGSSTVRVPAEATRPYWAEIDVTRRAGTSDQAIAGKARVIDASGTELRVAEVSVQGKATSRASVPPVVAKTTGDLVYEIEIGPNGRGDVAVERAKLIVYRSSRKEVITGLTGAFLAIAIGGIVFRIARRRAERVNDVS